MATEATKVTDETAGSSYEPVYDAAREATQKAALLDYQIRQNPAGWARVANGNAIKIQPGMPFKYPGEETHEMLDHPGGLWRRENGYWHLLRDKAGATTSMLLSPKPPFLFGGVESHRYGWFVRVPAVKDDLRPQQTAALHRQDKIRYIETHEINPDSPIAIFEEFATPNNTYVTSGTMILAEIMDATLSYRKYKGFDDLAIQRVMQVTNTVATSPSVETDAGNLPTHIPGKTETTVDGPKDTKRGG